MYLPSKISLNFKYYFSFILAAFPLSFIAGNMIINLNIFILIVSAILFFKTKLFKIKFFFLDKLIFFYFFLILISAIINDYYFFSEKMFWKGYFSTIEKSIFFLRYLLIYIALRFLLEKKYINLKYFFISSSFAALFVSIDILFQYFNGQDLFGFSAEGHHKLSGPFGDELIAGGFIQRFSLFSFFLIYIYFNNSNLKEYNKYLFTLLFLIFFSALILSGNRMPTIMFLFLLFMIAIFHKQIRKLFIPFLIVCLLVFTVLFKVNDKTRINFSGFYNQVYEMTLFIKNKDFSNPKSPQYLKEFSSFYNTWLMNKYLGGGIKNFRYYCHEKPNIIKNENFICNMHPHNYYLEILTETGLMGLLLCISIFCITLYISLFAKYFTHSSLQKNNIVAPFIFLFLAEIFPLKSTGSFFTTGNSTYLFLILGILIGLIRSENLIEKENNKYRLKL